MENNFYLNRNKRIIKEKESEETVMKTYKGFNKDMTCRGFQYKEGKEYTVGFRMNGV